MNIKLVATGIVIALCASIPVRVRAGEKATASNPLVVTAGKSRAEMIQKETRYLAFDIFTWSPDPRDAGFSLKGTTLPKKGPLLDYILDIKRRIGNVGDRHARLAVVLGPLACFDQTDAEIGRFIALGFNLALETNVAVGFKFDDSMFWANRKDLWCAAKNVEAVDWEGTPCTGRRLDWGKEPTAAPPQMCFNSTVILREIRHRSRVLGRAIQAGVRLLGQRGKPGLFAGVIAGSETMIGQDFKTGKYLGYRALLNRGFSRKHPPVNPSRELEKVVQEFIETWTTGLAEAGVSPEKIYSHTAFLSRKVFELSDNKGISYSQLNHYAPPSVAFGKRHRPGFSTYPQPGLFEDIYKELATHKQLGWASSEGTNLQLGNGPGQSGMNMETYLARMFNHGATLVDVYSWGVGGEANKNMDFRVVTEGEEALNAYRKFLSGGPLIEVAATTSTYLERLPTKIRRIQQDLPTWIQKTGSQALAESLMRQLDEALKAKEFEEAERVADEVLKMIGEGTPARPEEVSEPVRKRLVHEFGSAFLIFRDEVAKELKLSNGQRDTFDQTLREMLPAAMAVLEKIQSLSPEGRQSELEAYHRLADGKLANVQKEALDAGQLTRLSQLKMQREGLFGGAEIWNELHITDDQKRQFMAAIQPVEKQIESLMAEVQKGGNPDEIRTRVLTARENLELSLEALLTDSQRRQWNEMRGTPVDLGVLFELSSH